MAKKKPRKKNMQPAAEPEMKAVRLELSSETHRKLRAVAGDEDKSMAAFVREIVEEVVEERYDVLRGKGKEKH